VAALERSTRAARLRVEAAGRALAGLKAGDSIAVNGCCLTIVRRHGASFTADLSPETLARTALGGYRRGGRVNLEAPLRMGDRLSGHLMQGHVEATGTLLELRREGRDGGWWLTLEAPETVRPYLAPKGSIALDGISLTVAALDGSRVGIAIIPHTYRHTNLAHLQPGAAMNLETDPVARHLERLLEARGARAAKRTVTLAELQRQGF
ncbi:MAG: riboflavin synthase, partial [Terriglobales bacterium]